MDHSIHMYVLYLFFLFHDQCIACTTKTEDDQSTNMFIPYTYANAQHQKCQVFTINHNKYIKSIHPYIMFLLLFFSLYFMTITWTTETEDGNRHDNAL